MAHLPGGAPTAAAKPPKGKKPVPTRTSVATQTPPFAGYLTPAQQAARARAQALAAVAPVSQLSATTAANQQTTATETAKAVADLLRQVGPATQAPYLAAGAADAMFAKGLAHGQTLVQDQTRGEAAQTLDASGGRVQQPMVDAAIGGANVTDPLYTLGGYIPASTMNREGAAFGAAAARLPATALGVGQDASIGIGEKQVADQAALAAKLPAATQSALTSIQNYQAKLGSAADLADYRDATLGLRAKEAAAKQANDDRKFNLDSWAKQAGITGYIPGTTTLTLAGQKAVQSAAEAKVRADQADERLGMERVRVREQVAHNQISERQGNARIATANRNADTAAKNARISKRRADAYIKKTNAAAKAKLKEKPKGGRLTIEQTVKYTGEINSTVAGLKTGGTDPTTGEAHPALNYADAVTFLRNQGYMSSPKLRRISTAALRQWYGDPTKNAFAPGALFGPPA